MFTLADAFVVAPGGLGTLEEAFETMTGIQLGYHNKPIVFFDIGGFWAPMEVFLDHSVQAEVLRQLKVSNLSRVKRIGATVAGS